MILLALDTTTRAGGAAVLHDGRLVARVDGDPLRTQAERLPADLLAALDEAGASLARVDLFAVGCGPGSFTGLRVGIATIQGLAFASGRLVTPVTALEALACEAVRQAGARIRPGDRLAVFMNAQRREVFAQTWQVIDPSPAAPDLRALQPPLVELEATVLARLDLEGGGDLWLIGDSAPAVHARMAGSPRGSLLATPPNLAPTIGALASRWGLAAAVRPDAIQPLYVRRPDAEIARERGAGLAREAERS